MEIERRTLLSEATIEYRDADNGEKRPVIAGYASVFGKESRNLGGFVETIHPDAFDEVLSKNPDVVGVFNHEKNLLLGRTSNGTLKLSVDPHGLRYEIFPNTNTSVGKDVVEWVKDRTVVGSSFAFAVDRTKGEFWGTNDRGIRHREVRNVSILDDVGPVTRPAYDSSSVVVSRRCFEIALGENFRPNQTMANAARRGLRMAEKRDDVDQRLLAIAERVVNREIVSLEEVTYLREVQERCAAVPGGGWSGSLAYCEWHLAGGDNGRSWVHRRSVQEGDTVPLTADALPEQKSMTVTINETQQVIVEHDARADVSLKPTAGMAAACRRGLKLYEDGRGGDGLVPATISWARKIAAREPLTEEKVVKMRAWHARHKVDKKPGWDKAGEESPGFVAYLLWAGEAGRRFSEAKVAQMGKRDAGEEAMPEGYQSVGSLSERDLAYAEAVESIAEEYGPWPQGDAHYMARSPFANRGMACQNCVFFEAGACEVVQGEIAAGGVCKLWVIPEEKMTMDGEKREDVAVVEAVEATTEQAPDATPADADAAPTHDPSLEAQIKLAELNAVLLRTQLQSMKARV